MLPAEIIERILRGYDDPEKFSELQYRRQLLQTKNKYVLTENSRPLDILEKSRHRNDFQHIEQYDSRIDRFYPLRQTGPQARSSVNNHQQMENDSRSPPPTSRDEHSEEASRDLEENHNQDEMHINMTASACVCGNCGDCRRHGHVYENAMSYGRYQDNNSYQHISRAQPHPTDMTSDKIHHKICRKSTGFSAGDYGKVHDGRSNSNDQYICPPISTSVGGDANRHGHGLEPDGRYDYNPYKDTFAYGSRTDGFLTNRCTDARLMYNNYERVSVDNADIERKDLPEKHIQDRTMENRWTSPNAAKATSIEVFEKTKASADDESIMKYDHGNQGDGNASNKTAVQTSINDTDRIGKNVEHDRKILNVETAKSNVDASFKSINEPETGQRKVSDDTLTDHSNNHKEAKGKLADITSEARMKEYVRMKTVKVDLEDIASKMSLTTLLMTESFGSNHGAVIQKHKGTLRPLACGYEVDICPCTAASNNDVIRGGNVLLQSCSSTKLSGRRENEASSIHTSKIEGAMDGANGGEKNEASVKSTIVNVDREGIVSHKSFTTKDKADSDERLREADGLATNKDVLQYSELILPLPYNYEVDFGLCAADNNYDSPKKIDDILRRYSSGERLNTNRNNASSSSLTTGDQTLHQNKISKIMQPNVKSEEVVATETLQLERDKTSTLSFRGPVKIVYTNCSLSRGSSDMYDLSEEIEVISSDLTEVIIEGNNRKIDGLVSIISAKDQDLLSKNTHSSTQTKKQIAVKGENVLTENAERKRANQGINLDMSSDLSNTKICASSDSSSATLYSYSASSDVPSGSIFRSDAFKVCNGSLESCQAPEKNDDEIIKMQQIDYCERAIAYLSCRPCVSLVVPSLKTEKHVDQQQIAAKYSDSILPIPCTYEVDIGRVGRNDDALTQRYNNEGLSINQAQHEVVMIKSGTADANEPTHRNEIMTSEGAIAKTEILRLEQDKTKRPNWVDPAQTVHRVNSFSRDFSDQYNISEEIEVISSADQVDLTKKTIGDEMIFGCDSQLKTSENQWTEEKISSIQNMSSLGRINSMRTNIQSLPGPTIMLDLKAESALPVDCKSEKFKRQEWEPISSENQRDNEDEMAHTDCFVRRSDDEYRQITSIQAGSLGLCIMGRDCDCEYEAEITRCATASTENIGSRKCTLIRLFPRVQRSIRSMTPNKLQIQVQVLGTNSGTTDGGDRCKIETSREDEALMEMSLTPNIKSEDRGDTEAAKGIHQEQEKGINGSIESPLISREGTLTSKSSIGLDRSLKLNSLVETNKFVAEKEPVVNRNKEMLVRVPTTDLKLPSRKPNNCKGVSRLFHKNMDDLALRNASTATKDGKGKKDQLPCSPNSKHLRSTTRSGKNCESLSTNATSIAQLPIFDERYSEDAEPVKRSEERTVTSKSHFVRDKSSNQGSSFKVDKIAVRKTESREPSRKGDREEEVGVLPAAMKIPSLIVENRKDDQKKNSLTLNKPSKDTVKGEKEKAQSNPSYSHGGNPYLRKTSSALEHPLKSFDSNSVPSYEL